MYILVSNMPDSAIRLTQYLNDKKMLSGIIIQNSSKQSILISFRSFFSNIYYGLKSRSDFPWVIKQKRQILIKLIKQLNCPIFQVNDVNTSEDVKSFMSTTTSKYVIVIGGRIIKKDLLNAFKGEWINIHGGILPQYRGLDSEYWATLNSDFGNIGVTVHKIVEKVDFGDILFQKKLIVDNFDDSLKSVILRNHENLYLAAIEFVENWGDKKIISNSSKKYYSLDTEAKYYSSPKKTISFNKKLLSISQNE